MTEHIEHLELALPTPVDLDNDARTLTGQILPFNVRAARTSAGRPVEFRPGSLVLPTDISRVKLLTDHDMSRPVGYATAITQDDQAATASFRVADGPDGDQALDSARQKLRDGLSVGIDVLKGHNAPGGKAYIIEQAQINEVSLCAIPAFSDARVTSVRASTTTPEQEPTMPDQTTETTAAPEAATFTHEAPFTTTRRAPLTLEAAYDAIAGAIQASTSASQITAALADVLTTDDTGKGLLPDQLIGEVWTAQRQETPYIDFAFARKQLTGIDLKGWAWQAKARVDDYAGNKTEIPTNKPSTRPVSTTAKRLAGGWDVDRVFVDLGDGSMIREITEQAIQDYKDKSNARARAALLASATYLGEVAAETSLAAILIALGETATSIGARLDYLAMAPDVWSQFASLTADEVPWWFRTNDGIGINAEAGNVSNVRIWADPELASGQWVAGDKRAATWWSKEPPVRLTAVDLPRGGIDIGVFGYYGSLVNEPLAVWTNINTDPEA